VAAKSEICVQSGFQRGDVLFVDSRDLWLSPRQVGQLLQRISTSQSERLAQQRATAGNVAVGDQSSSAGGERLEAVDVHGGRVERECITVTPPLDGAGPEASAEVRYVLLQCIRGVSGWCVAPHRVGETVEPHGLSTSQGQCCEQRLRAHSTNDNRSTVVTHGLQRAHETDLDGVLLCHCRTRSSPRCRRRW
jgi:hypothetical protein